MFEIDLIICIKMDLTLNNLKKLICHKIQPTNQPTNQPTYLSLYLSINLSSCLNWFLSIYLCSYLFIYHFIFIYLLLSIPIYLCVPDMTLNPLMVWLQPWSFGECGVPLCCHCSQVHSDWVVAPDRVLSMGQTELFYI